MEILITGPLWGESPYLKIRYPTDRSAGTGFVDDLYWLEYNIDGLVQDCSISSNGDTAVLHWAIDNVSLYN